MLHYNSYAFIVSTILAVSSCGGRHDEGTGSSAQNITKSAESFTNVSPPKYFMIVKDASGKVISQRSSDALLQAQDGTLSPKNFEMQTAPVIQMPYAGQRNEVIPTQYGETQVNEVIPTQHGETQVNDVIPRQNGYMAPQNGYQPPQSGIQPPQPGEMQPQQSGIQPPQPGEMQPQQSGYQPPQQGAMEPQQNGFQPPQQGAMQPQQNGFQPPQQGAMQPQQNGFQAPQQNVAQPQQNPEQSGFQSPQQMGAGPQQGPSQNSFQSPQQTAPAQMAPKRTWTYSKASSIVFGVPIIFQPGFLVGYNPCAGGTSFLTGGFTIMIFQRSFLVPFTTTFGYVNSPGSFTQMTRYFYTY